MRMARRCRMLPVPGFFDCSWAEYDVDNGRPTTTRNVMERVNLFLEGYFRALYVPLGGAETHMEFYISMFSDKPPCMPLCFGIGVVIILPEATGAFSFFISYFLASTTGDFSFSISSLLAYSSTFSSFLGPFFHFLFFLRLSFQP